MDGTLTRPVLDFAAIRRELGISGGDLAVEIGKLPPSRQEEAWAVVEAHERRALEEQTLQEGCLEFLEKCRDHGLRVGLVTRNSSLSVDHFCREHGIRFDGTVTREFPHLKPHPAPVVHLLQRWRIAPHEALVIGDYRYDIDSGRAAGTFTCFFQNPHTPFHGEDADFVVHSMHELDDLVFGASPAPGRPPP